MARRKRVRTNGITRSNQAPILKTSVLNCPNCLTKLQPEALFCHHCGQEQTNLHIGFWELLKDFISSNFNFDTRLLTTLKCLLFKPGFLAQEFSQGRRADYVPPIRLYLFISFVYFLVLSFDLDQQFNGFNTGEKAKIGETAANSPQLSATDTGYVTLKGINKKNGAELDLMIEEGELKEYPMLEHLVSQGARLLNDPDAHQSELRRLFYKSLSLSMFFLMPVFGFLLWLLWGKPRPFYIDVLIFSIHSHAFAFLVLSAKNLFSIFTLSSWLDLLTFLLCFTYLVIGVKRLKAIAWWKSFRKSLLLLLLYSSIVGITLLFIGIVSIWFV